jgi:hypothetical protein
VASGTSKSVSTNTTNTTNTTSTTTNIIVVLRVMHCVQWAKQVCQVNIDYETRM